MTTRDNSIRPGLLAELRRRRVLRTLALYILAAWGVMQVADVVFPALDIPEQAIRYLLVAAVGGFPVALIFAWLFNITPTGIRRTGRCDGSEEIVTRLQKRDYLVLAALAAVLGLIVFEAVNRVVETPADGTAKAVSEPGDGPPMLAVLPFTYRGAGDDAELFAGGVHDDLLTQLSQLSGLRVISRTSVQRYAGSTRSLPEIGSELGADAILEGGVQLAGGQIRINAQLIDARSDAHLWAQTFDRELTPENIFAVQAEIARSIAGALSATLSADETAQLDVLPTSNLAAYRAFHRAQQLIYDDYRPDRARGIELLEEAIALDPTFVEAMAELAYALSLSNFGGRDAAQAARVEDLVARIGELAPASVAYRVAQVYYLYYVVRDYEAADQMLEQARARAPSNLLLVHLQSWVKKRMGDFDAWIDLTYEGRRLEPNPEWTPLLVYRLQAVHRYAEALRVGDAERDPLLKLSLRLSRARIFEHHDLGRSRNEVEALVRSRAKAGDDYAREFLLLAQLSERDYDAAAATLEDFSGAGDRRAEEPLRRIPLYLEWALQVLLLDGDAPALEAALENVRQQLGLDNDPDGERYAELFVGDRILLALAAGDRREALSALEELENIIDGDIAPMIVMRPLQCRGLAMAGAAAEAVRCLRAGIDRPSKVHPFFEPLLPYYDGIRQSPEFQRLIESLVVEGWLEAPAP